MEIPDFLIGEHHTTKNTFIKTQLKILLRYNNNCFGFYVWNSKQTYTIFLKVKSFGFEVFKDYETI